MGALHQHVALVLGQGTKNLKHELAARRGRVYGVLQRCQVQPAAAQVLDDLNQVLGGAAQPVESANNDRITGPSVTQQFFPVRLMDLHAGHRIGVEGVAARLAQGVELQVEHLLVGCQFNQVPQSFMPLLIPQHVLRTNTMFYVTHSRQAITLMRLKKLAPMSESVGFLHFSNRRFQRA